MPSLPLEVLHVEDDFADAKIVRDCLNRSRLTEYQLFHVPRINEALSYLRQTDVHIILLDVMVPDAAELRWDLNAIRRCSSAPIVLLTGLPVEEVGKELLAVGNIHYLDKNKISAEAIDFMLAEIFTPVLSGAPAVLN